MDASGRNISFPIKNADGTPFHDLVLRKAAVETVVMSLGDKITGDVYYKDNSLVVTMHEYVLYNGVKYILVNPPSIVREGVVSTDSSLKGMAKYSFEFYHPMCVLNNLPFSDVAVNNDESLYLSQNKTFSWIGKPQDFIDKLNKNLESTEWVVVKNNRFPSGKDNELSGVLQFDKATIGDALKTWYDTWEIPFVITQIPSNSAYYSIGKRFFIEVGLPDSEITVNGDPFVFKFGQGVGLKNNSRTSRNNKIVTRIAGNGSENNIPYGYPQIRWYGNPDWEWTKYDYGAHVVPAQDAYQIYWGIVGGQRVKLIKHPFTRTKLMPSIYRETVFNKVSPYLSDGTANPNYDEDIEIKDYYDAIYSEDYQYPNEINPNAPSYESHEFEDIKPELGEEHILSATPLNNDLTPAQNWDDDIDDDGNFNQSYFEVTLPVLGFDLYACASITEEMQINMRSGGCIGCTFPVQIDWDDYKANFFDTDGNFAPNGAQRDLTKYPKSNVESISLILQKENSTFGVIMPNRYQYPIANDTFVILGISLPEEYILNAESRLDNEMKTYMLENNVYYFDYPLKFDEYFLANNTNILSQIHTNSVVRFEYNGLQLELFVKQITVKYNESVLPQYDITLTDNIEVTLNQFGKIESELHDLGALVSSLRQSYGTNVWDAINSKLSKKRADTAAGKITFEQGLDSNKDLTIGRYIQGYDGAKINEYGDAEINTAYIRHDFNAHSGVVDSLRSADFLKGQLSGRGYSLYSDDNGKKTLEIDNLIVRLKAFFAELEIRKMSYVGGDFIFSAAGSKIYKVEYIDADGEVIATQELHILVDGNGKFIMQDNVPVVWKEQIIPDMDDVKKFRCYEFSDDGTTATMNWWQVNDQARCQTFNIQAGRYDNVANRYYWRLVVGVGQKADSDGKIYNYVDLSNEVYDGDDIPAAGDAIVQLGARGESSRRQNAIEVIVEGDDAPAIIEYKGIHSFSLDGCRKTVLSPNGDVFIAKSFTIETDSGSFRVPVERGAWVSGTAYGYYDRVSHNGSLWLCIVNDGTTTLVEPTDSAQVWLKQVAQGESGEAQTFYTWIKYADELPTAQTTIYDTPTANTKYIGIAANKTSSTASTNYLDYKWSKIKGDDGTDGQDGNDGTSISIVSQSVTYQVSASGTTVPTGTWLHQPPSVPERQFLWTRTVVTYSDNTMTTSYSVAYQGGDGADGTSIAIKGTLTSTSDLPSSGNVIGDGYIINGELWMWDGTTWVNCGRIKGEDGLTAYVHYAWCNTYDNSDSSFTRIKVAGVEYLYMGIYADHTATDSSVFSDYTWNLIRGAEGERGTVIKGNVKAHIASKNAAAANGVYLVDSPFKVSTLSSGTWTDATPESGDAYIDENGKLWSAYNNSWLDLGIINGKSAYVHYAWANSVGSQAEDFEDFTTTKTVAQNFNYMGVYADDIATDSTNPLDYDWNKIVGEDGVSVGVAYSDSDAVVIDADEYGRISIISSVSGLPTTIQLLVDNEAVPTNTWTSAAVQAFGKLYNLINGNIPTVTSGLAIHSITNGSNSKTLEWEYLSANPEPINVNSRITIVISALYHGHTYQTAKTIPVIVTRKGASADAVMIQYSVGQDINGDWHWHSTYANGDLWMRMSTDGGTTWSDPIRIVGADGTSVNIKGQADYHVSTADDVEDAEQVGWFLVDYDSNQSVQGVGIIVCDDVDYSIFHRVPVTIGDGYILRSTGHLFVAANSGWVDAGLVKGDKGDDAMNVIVTPSSVILTQENDGTINYTNAKANIVVTKGGNVVTPTLSIGTVPEGWRCTARLVGNEISITRILTDSSGIYYSNGYVPVVVQYGSFVTTIKFAFYVNLLGTWKQQIIGDVNSAIANKVVYDYDSGGNITFYDFEGNFIFSATEVSLMLQEYQDNVFVTQSELSQTASSITAIVTNNFGTAGLRIINNGIDIYGNIHSADVDDSNNYLWQLNPDGSGRVAGGNISWTADGTLEMLGTFKGVLRRHKVVITSENWEDYIEVDESAGFTEYFIMLDKIGSFVELDASLSSTSINTIKIMLPSLPADGFNNDDSYNAYADTVRTWVGCKLMLTNRSSVWAEFHGAYMKYVTQEFDPTSGKYNYVVKDKETTVGLNQWICLECFMRNGQKVIRNTGMIFDCEVIYWDFNVGDMSAYTDWNNILIPID